MHILPANLPFSRTYQLLNIKWDLFPLAIEKKNNENYET